MKKLFIAIALLGLMLSGGSAALTFLGVVSVPLNKTLLIVGMVLWFAGATPWLAGRQTPADKEVEI